MEKINEEKDVFLLQKGVTTVLNAEQRLGPNPLMEDVIDYSFLADNPNAPVLHVRR